MMKTEVKSEALVADLVITGVHCWECAWHLELALESFEGVVAANVDAVTGVTAITYHPGLIDLDELLTAVRAEDYEVGAPMIHAAKGAG